MRLLFLVEKPFVAKSLAPLMASRWPDAELSFVCSCPLGVFLPVLPRGTSWASYPLVVPFEVDDFSFREASLFRGWRWIKDTQTLEPAWIGDVHRGQEWLEAADRVVCLEGGEDLFHADVMCQCLVDKRLLDTAEVYPLWSLDAGWVSTTLSTPAESHRSWAVEAIERGRVRHYFNHQFAVNSVAVLRKTAQGLSPARSPWISKYQLQLIQAMVRQEPLTESQWLALMGSWPGTGRYARDEHSPGLGSLRSRSAIFQQLEAHGWCGVQEGSKRVLPTSVGHRFVERLHPDCWDPDLPFRLQQWMDQGFEQSQPAMDRYVRTFFGKQKRFLDKALTR